MGLDGELTSMMRWEMDRKKVDMLQMMRWEREIDYIGLGWEEDLSRAYP